MHTSFASNWLPTIVSLWEKSTGSDLCFQLTHSTCLACVPFALSCVAHWHFVITKIYKIEKLWIELHLQGIACAMLSSVKGNVLDKILFRDSTPFWKILEAQVRSKHLNFIITLHLSLTCLKIQLIPCGAIPKLKISPTFLMFY